MPDQRSGTAQKLLDRIVGTVVLTGAMAGVAYGSMWSVGWNGAAFAGLVIFLSLWIGGLYVIWVIS